MTEKCIGVLLAGGLARRMGGGDKALQEVAGTTILDRMIAALSPQCSGLILNANGDPGRLKAYGLPIVGDDPPDFKGPLAGVLAGLDWIAANAPGTSFALSAPTDAPFLPHDLVARLFAARRAEGAEIACARSGGREHSVIALWPVAIRQDLRHALFCEDLRKVGFFLRRHAVAYADWEIEPFDPFFNANAPDDLRIAEEIAMRPAASGKIL
ncbi:molybdopterin-guanine dinucleotide biosynthesis protein A [Methylocella silvestris BL2]|uniref:Molybdenum cofactor guanylyltransferase n=1 Tax=Methylocella silvestris (strain DSM 15510 / CIP 108128 / LMG 27833 / NCIMB 13906 / BL2) TaxID=395965 RepID=B8EP62_METSB|nr:molybdenum cofactor guanylyltransferase MobA [Methylocella silvestris]ACK49650.1 molybdopterin-guanine dinucleotide biosynthesis protein A [Methylocella silvestris BL2]